MDLRLETLSSADAKLFKVQISVFPSGARAGKITESVACQPSKGTIMSGPLIRIESNIANEKYATDVARTLQHTRWLLGILGVWPMVKKDPKKWEIWTSKILVALCFLLLLFIIIPSLSHMILREKNRFVILMLFAPVGFAVTNILKFCTLMFHRKILKHCMEHLEFDWMQLETENDREIMTRNVNVGRNLTVLCAFFMYTGGLSYHTIMPWWRGNEINEVNETIRPLVYPGYDMFVNAQQSPIYEMIFYTHCFSSFVTHTITTAACNLAATFVAHACGQIEIIMSRLETLFENTHGSHEVTEKRLGSIIKFHVRVLRFTSMIETLLREICLVEVVASIVIICLLEYYCLTEWNNCDAIAIITYFVLLMSFSFNIFIFCHIGELLKEQCFQISEAAYMIEWYRFPGKTGIALVMIIAMANYPRKLTAGGMMELSISSFGAVIKSSAVYFNMLRTMAY